MEKKSPNSGSEDGEIPLPLAMIHHIQSFMSGKEAARTTVISQSWGRAWLTRPSIYIDDRDFGIDNRSFLEFANKTFQRYQDSSLKIDSFTLRSRCCEWCTKNMARYLIVGAMKIGATNLELELQPDYHVLPQEVLESATLIRLSLRLCRVDGSYAVRCSTLKSLALEDVEFTSYDLFKELITCCSVSIEELSLSNTGYIRSTLSLEGMNMYKLHNLRRLCLHSVKVDSMFFPNVASWFPFLKDLSIEFDHDFKGIQIASRSLETISFKVSVGAWKFKAQFDVPNIRKFTCYSGLGLPDLSINGGSREWDLAISICCNRFCTKSWFLRLRKLLTKFRLSKIVSLYIELNCNKKGSSVDEVNTEVVGNHPLVLENLTMDALPSQCCALLARLFSICRPKFITHYWFADKYHPVRSRNAFLDVLCKTLMHTRITPNCGIPDQNMFGMFNLKRVNVEVYEMFGTEWRPLVLKEPLDATQTPANKRKVWFQLVWED